MKIVLATVFLFLIAPLVYAEVPQPVIDECHAIHADSYNNIPNCLREGVVAFEMLNLALQDDYYGLKAQEVIDGCRDKNEEYESVWICFRNASEKATEIRGMIGVDNMKDRCYVYVSDPKTYDRIMDKYHQSRRKNIDKIFYGGQSYFPFKGCPDPKPE